MGLVDRFAGWLGYGRKTKRAPGVGGIRSSTFDAAVTDRLNSNHWLRTTDASLNQLLMSHLKTIRMRCVHERRNNPVVGASVRGLQIGVVGPGGPRLQVMSKSKRFSKQSEKVWAQWWKRPEVNGRLSGDQMLKQWVGNIPTHGEYLAQFVFDSTVPEGEISTRILSIDTRRLETLGHQLSIQADGSYIILGIRRTETGKPIEYSFRDRLDEIGYAYKYRWVPARDVIHGFEAVEAGQARGLPWLTECLSDTAELRDFDAATLRAARAAAEMSVLLEATNVDVEFVEVDSEVEIEPNTMGTVPPGYHAMQLKAEHPGANYKEFRHERLRNVGLAFQQPLMSTILDSSGHSYSSARFDGQSADRVHKCIRLDLQETAIERMFWRVMDEAQLLGMVPAVDRSEVSIVLHWEPRPHVDPFKEARGQVERLKNNLTSHTYECGKLGLDYIDEVLPMLAKERDARAALGLPDPTYGETPTVEEDSDGDSDESKPAGQSDDGGDESDNPKQAEAA